MATLEDILTAMQEKSPYDRVREELIQQITKNPLDGKYYISFSSNGVNDFNYREISQLLVKQDQVKSTKIHRSWLLYKYLVVIFEE